MEILQKKTFVNHWIEFVSELMQQFNDNSRNSHETTFFVLLYISITRIEILAELVTKNSERLNMV